MPVQGVICKRKRDSIGNQRRLIGSVPSRRQFKAGRAESASEVSAMPAGKKSKSTSRRKSTLPARVKANLKKGIVSDASPAPKSTKTKKYNR